MTPLALEARAGYLHIVGAGLDLPVVGPPPANRAAPVTVFLALGALHRTCLAPSYELGAQQLLEVVRAWVEGGPLVLLADLAELAAEASSKHVDDNPEDMTADLDELRGFAARADGRLGVALAETLAVIAAVAAASRAP